MPLYDPCLRQGRITTDYQPYPHHFPEISDVRLYLDARGFCRQAICGASLHLDPLASCISERHALNRGSDTLACGL